MSSSVIQGCFPNGFRTTPAVAQRAVEFPRATPFPPGRTASPAQQTTVQRSGSGTAMRLPEAMASAASRSIGQPLQPAVRQMMESLFRTSFADVRVHVGPHVAAIGATSFTQGANIHFAPGLYAPEHGVGRQRLAYELAHVLQQKAGRVRSPSGAGTVVVHDQRLEAEAQLFAGRAAAAPVQVTHRNHAQRLEANAGPRGAKPSRAGSCVQRAISRGRTAVIQYKRIGVGFDRHDVGREGDVLVTSGLANCIAIVAWDETTRTAVMVHFNTMIGMFAAMQSEGEWEERTATLVTQLNALKGILDAQLAVGAGRAVEPVYRVGVGRVWLNIDQEKPLWMSRMDLLRACIRVFGAEAQVGGATIAFDVTTGTMTGTFLDPEDTIQRPNDWAHSGTELNYNLLS